MDKTAKPPVRDEVFSDGKATVGDFVFNDKVAAVFDDMVSRSVPFYDEIQRMIAEIAVDYATPGSRVYDLGCSTGTTLLAMNPLLDPSIEFVGMDNSHEMLERCRQKLDAAGTRKCDLHWADFNQGVEVSNASLVLLVLTLQFLRPLNRQHLMTDIHKGLNENGCLILVEKVLGEDSLFNRQFIKYYYDYKKRRGYSDIEITRKREALENVLIPYKLFENRDLLLQSGFRHVEIFFKWYNFCGVMAVK